jgi:endonuclease YncB( thermonuclease family)
MGSCISYSIYKSHTLDNNNEEICYLNHIEYKDTVVFRPHITHGKVIKVYDGDTITIATRLLHDKTIYRFSIRLRGIDSPEIHGKTENEKLLAIKSRDALTHLIHHKIVVLKNVEYEKYGRLLADIYLLGQETNPTINQWMLDEKYAIPYDGRAKNIPKEWV